MLGEVKDQLSFYYSPEEWERFVNFFHYLHGRSRFNYNEFLESYRDFTEFINRNNEKVPKYAQTADGFLQFLYDLNVIQYIAETVEGKFFWIMFSGKDDYQYRAESQDKCSV